VGAQLVPDVRRIGRRVTAHRPAGEARRFPLVLGLCNLPCGCLGDDTEAELELRRGGEVRARCLNCGARVAEGLGLHEVSDWLREYREASA
jgi:hypothetical protein